MAFTRKWLSALGIEADKVDEIITEHVAVTDALKEERDNYKKDAEQLPEVVKERDELKNKISGEDPYKEKFEKLQKEYDDYKKDIEAQATTQKKELAFRKILKEIGIPEKRIDSVIKAFFGGGSVEDMPEAEVTEADFKDGQIDAIQIMVATGLVKTRSDGRRAIEQGGVIINGEKVTDVRQSFTKDALYSNWDTANCARLEYNVRPKVS